MIEGVLQVIGRCEEAEGTAFNRVQESILKVGHSVMTYDV